MQSSELATLMFGAYTNSSAIDQSSAAGVQPWLIMGQDQA
jgi:hypothetical protein